MVSFIELPNAVNTITVYASKDKELRFVAVYSRHNEIFGTPTPSQQLGSCKSWGADQRAGSGRHPKGRFSPKTAHQTTSNRVEMWDSTW